MIISHYLPPFPPSLSFGGQSRLPGYFLHDKSKAVKDGKTLIVYSMQNLCTISFFASHPRVAEALAEAQALAKAGSLFSAVKDSQAKGQ